MTASKSGDGYKNVAAGTKVCRSAESRENGPKYSAPRAITEELGIKRRNLADNSMSGRRIRGKALSFSDKTIIQRTMAGSRARLQLIGTDIAKSGVTEYPMIARNNSNHGVFSRFDQ